jgi:hypothetical protein
MALMIRTVVYPGTSTAADDVPSKLLKYIPAEVIAFYVPIYALVPKAGALGLWAVLIISIAATVGYLWVRADPTSPPRLYFYILAAVAFVCWALGTSTIGADLWKFPDWVSRAAVPSGVLLVPLIDEILTKLNPKTTRMS